MVRQRDLTRGRVGAAAEESGVGDGVVRGAEGAQGEERAFVGEKSADAVDFGGLDGFLKGHRRHDGGDALGEHRLARPRRPDHDQVVPARDGHLDGAFGGVLAAHVGEIDLVVLVRLNERLGDCGRERFVAAQKLERLAQVAHAVSGDPLDNGGFLGVSLRHNNGAFAAPTGFQGDRQHAVDGSHAAVERQFAHKAVLVKIGELDLLRGRDHRQRDGEVEARPLLLHVGGGEVDGGAALGPAVAAVGDRRGHAVPALLDCRIRQPHDHDGRGS